MSRFLVLLLASTLMSACTSATMMSVGGYSMVHMNNPECMGMSAAGVLVIRQSDDSIVESDITQKSGYCETLTGQVITSGAKIVQGHEIGKGLKDSGTENNTNTAVQQSGAINDGSGGTSPIPY